MKPKEAEAYLRGQIDGFLRRKFDEEDGKIHEAKYQILKIKFDGDEYTTNFRVIDFGSHRELYKQVLDMDDFSVTWVQQPSDLIDLLITQSKL